MLETLGHFKVELLNRLISAGHLLLFPVVYLAPQLSHKVIALALAGLGSLVAWLAAFRRYHLIAYTPTSRIASAAQGYVELEGRCEPHPGSAPLGFLSGPPCVCYRYVTHRLSGCEWQFIDRGQSSETFLLLDESGTCVIDPEQAEVLTTHRRKWVSGHYKQQVEYLAPGDMIYALGELAIPLIGIRLFGSAKLHTPPLRCFSSCAGALTDQIALKLLYYPSYLRSPTISSLELP
jgi:hypothetical protein